MEVRTAYLREYPNRTFSAVDENNDVYDKLYKELSSDHMEMYREKAAKQAKTAMEHFKDDFVYKIRSAIREAYQRRDELNRMISGLDFGKDFQVGNLRLQEIQEPMENIIQCLWMIL